MTPPVHDPWLIYALAVAASVLCILWRYRHQPHTRRVHGSIIAVLALLTALALYQHC